VETLRTYVRALKVFASWLYQPKQGYTRDQRLALLPMPRKGNVQKLPLNQQEVEVLLAACDTTTVLGSRDHALLLTLLDGSLRTSEIIGLSVGHVNLDKGTLFILYGKGRKSRTVAVGANTCRVLRRYAFLRDASSPLGPAPSDAPFFQTDEAGAFAMRGCAAGLSASSIGQGCPVATCTCCAIPQRSALSRRLARIFLPSRRS
jgi:site-specific recombinase XerD